MECRRFVCGRARESVPYKPRVMPSILISYVHPVDRYERVSARLRGIFTSGTVVFLSRGEFGAERVAESKRRAFNPRAVAIVGAGFISSARAGKQRAAQVRRIR